MLAFIAPGQGAQTPGMLAPWITDPAAKLLLSQWSHEIDLDLVRLGTTADSDEIKDTANAQPLIVAAGLLGARALGGARSDHRIGPKNKASKPQSMPPAPYPSPPTPAQPVDTF